MTGIAARSTGNPIGVPSVHPSAVDCRPTTRMHDEATQPRRGRNALGSPRRIILAIGSESSYDSIPYTFVGFVELVQESRPWCRRDRVAILRFQSTLSDVHGRVRR
jgi:hypothetical protein